MKMFRGSQIQTILLVVILLIFFSSLGGTFSLLSTGDIGYSTGFQGPKARYYGVRYEGNQYTTKEKHDASMATFDTALMFDSDGWNDGKPNLEGEMTSVFAPEESLSGIASWVPYEWLKRNAVIQNPQRTYSWNISDKTYKMEQWVLKHYISFSVNWDSDKEAGAGVILPGQGCSNVYSNLEVWIEFDLEPTWYIQGGGVAYFALGKIQLAHGVEYSAQDVHGNEVEPDSAVSVNPESEGAITYIFYGPWGTGKAETEASSYQGKELNPDLFRDKVYAKFTLAHFGSHVWSEVTAIKRKGDVVTVDFDITVFVIGEWDVKDIQKIPEDFGRTAKTGGTVSIMDYLSDPKIQALLTALIMAGFFLLLLVAAPGFVFAAIALFRGGKRR